MDELMKLLQDINGDVDYTKEKHLIDDGIFVSFDIIMCVSGCEEKFGIEIPAEAIVEENFQSVDSIWRMVSSLMKQ